MKRMCTYFESSSNKDAEKQRQNRKSRNNQEKYRRNYVPHDFTYPKFFFPNLKTSFVDAID